MKRFVEYALAALAVALGANIAVADDLPAPGAVQLFWQMEAFRAPPGVPSELLPEFRIGEIVPMAEGGVLVSVYREVFADFAWDKDLYLIRLAPDGKELWRVDNLLCSIESPSCGDGDVSDAPIVATDDGGFIVLLSRKIIHRYDRSGVFVRARQVSRCDYHRYEAMIAHGDAVYLAGDCELRSDNSGSGTLVRWEPACADCWGDCPRCWQLRLPLRSDGLDQSGYGLDLDFLTNGNLLWTIQGLPGMRLGPSGRWQIRVTPTGRIVPPGPLETSLQSDRGEWLVFASSLLPDGRLIRLLQDHRGQPGIKVSLEIWDGTGSQRILRRVLGFGKDVGTGYNLEIYYPEMRPIDTRGRSAFYLTSYNNMNLQIAGFDSSGDVEWQTILPIDSSNAVGDGTSNRVYIATQFNAAPERQRAPAIYITSVE